MIVSVQKAAKLIRSGDVVGLPTETVYGLAADASNVLAVQKIFELKQRPADNPLIVHISDPSQAASLAETDSEDFMRLAKAFWPGPLTLVLPKKPQVLDVITTGLETVALRIPDHSIALSVIDEAGPVAAPSANRSGRPSPTRVKHVEDDFSKSFPVVDGGICTIGIESTVLDLSGDAPAILRPGKVTARQIEKVLGKKVHLGSSGEQKRRSPGTRYSHYKPEASVQWMESPESIDHYRSDTLYIYHACPIDKSYSNIVHFKKNYTELGKSLYDLYRTADKNDYQQILIEPLPKTSQSPIIPALLNRIQRSLSQ